MPFRAPPSRARRPATAPLLLTALLTAMSGAQAQTWNGMGVSSGWSDPLNWQGLQVPTSGSRTAITFAGTRRLTPVQNINSVFSLNALTFASGAGAFDLSGNTLRWVGSDAVLVQNSVNAMVIRNTVEIAGTLTYSGIGSTQVAGAVTRSTGTARSDAVLVKRGSGQLALAVAGTFDGSVVVDAGQVLLRDRLALQSASVTLNVADGLSFGSLSEATLGNLSGSGALALGNTVLTLNPVDTAVGQYSGAITGGAGALTKAGAGTTRLAGASQFNRLRVNAGRLQLEGGSLLLSHADEGLVVAGGTLDLSGGASLSALARTTQVDGAAGTILRVAGNGSQLNTGFQTLVGNHAQGRLVVEDGGVMNATTFLAMGFNNGSIGTFAVGAGAQVTSGFGLLGTLSGSQGSAEVAGLNARWTNGSMGIGGFDDNLKGGSGQLTVRNGGRVTVNDSLAFWSNAASVLVDGGTIQVGSLTSGTGFGSLVLQADPANGLGLDGAPALQLTGSGTASFSGSLTGAGSLLKTGSGVQTFAGGSPGFTGTTTLQAGRLVVGHQDALRGSSVRIEIDNGLDLNGLPQVVLGSLAGSGRLALGNTQLTLGEDGRHTVYGGVLVGGDTARLVKKGTGTQQLTGVGSTLYGATVEGGGKLVLSGGSLTLNSNRSDGAMALLLNPGGRVEVVNGGRLSATAAGASSVFVEGDAVSELLIEGPGSRVDVGFQAIVGNTAQGRLRVRQGGVLQSQTFVAAGVANGSQGLMEVESGGQVQAGWVPVGVLSGAQGQVRVSGTGSLLSAFELGMGGLSDAQNGGTGLLQILNRAQVVTTQTRFWTAGSRIEIDGGSLVTGGLFGPVGHVQLSADPTHGAALTLNRSGVTYSFSGSIGGDGSLLKQGSGTQLLLGSNTFTGSVRVDQGQLRMDSGAAYEYQVASGATLQLGQRNLGSAVVNVQAGGLVSYANTTLAGGLLMGLGQHDLAVVRRVVGTQFASGSLIAPAHGTTFVGVANQGRVDVLAGRTLSWSGGGLTTGSLRAAGTVQVDGFSSGGLIDILPGGQLSASGGAQAPLVLGGGSRTHVGSASQPGGAIVLAGDTRLQLNGGLLVNNGTISGTVEVNFGGLAKGAGSFGTVVVGDGGRFSPGNSPGRVDSSAATWAAGGSLLVELAAASGNAGQQWDLWALSGGLDITAGSTANSRFTISLATLDGSHAPAPLAGFDTTQAWQWLIVDTGTGIQGFDPSRVALDTQGFLSPLNGGSLNLAVQNGDLYLVFAPVPEPSAWALMLGGLAGLAWRKRVALRRAQD